MSFGGGSARPTNGSNPWGGVNGTTSATGASAPPYTPTRADGSIVTAGILPIQPSKIPSQSNAFATFIGGMGGLGRKPALAGRTLIGGN